MINTLTMNNISIKAKIVTLSAILISANIFVAAYAMIKMASIGKEITAIAKEHIPLTNVVSEVAVKQLEQAISYERALRYSANPDDPAAAEHYEHGIEAFDAYSHVIARRLKDGERLAVEATDLAHTVEDRREFGRVAKIINNIKKEHLIYEEHVREVIELLDDGKSHQALERAEAIEKQEDKLEHELESLLSEIGEFTASSALKAEHDEKNAITLLSITSLFTIVVCTLFAFYITSNIARGINKAVGIAECISTGDLTQNISVDSGGEIGRLLEALQLMQNKLHNMIGEMNQSSIELAAASEQLAAVSEQANQNLHQQQMEVEQVATAMNEMSATIHEVAKNAAASADAANNANKEASEGGKVVLETIGSIERLAGGVEKACVVIQQLATDSENIGSVLDVIIGVAEQTNLLALNAAIEAARAGEQGRGFAVVADEVRTLAQRTQQSTHEIEKMIEKLHNGTQNAVAAMNESQGLANNSVEEAARAGASLNGITTAVESISDMNIQIASAAEEQSSVAEEMNNNIIAVSSIGEQNAAAANETTSSSEELARMATHLQVLVSRFTV